MCESHPEDRRILASVKSSTDVKQNFRFPFPAEHPVEGFVCLYELERLSEYGHIASRRGRRLRVSNK
jgi:hypothetical protein